MKITNSEVIRNGEQELIEGILADLDWGTIDGVIKEKHGLELEEDVEFKDGDLVVVDNKVAYRLDFQVKLNLSILLDREGNYLSLEASTKNRDPGRQLAEPQDSTRSRDEAPLESMS